MRAAVLLIASATLVTAQSLESWNTVESRISTHGKLDVILHTQFRLRTTEGQFTQGRVGPVVRYAWSPRVSLIAGYFYRRLEYKNQWGDSHRYWGGFQVPLRVGSWSLTSRTIAEHHFAGPAPNQGQFRQAFRVAMNRKISPAAQHETFFDQHGYLESRTTAGTTVRIGETGTAEIAYLYGWRPVRAGGNRQALTLSFRFDSPLHFF